MRIGTESWRKLGQRLKLGEVVIRMACCHAHGILKTSPLGRHFFAHRARPAECNWKPETPEHIELKANAYEAVLATPGWSAEIESCGPDWRADVLAIRGRVRIAFEIQLSAQGQAQTWFRERRYEGASVLPWWIVTTRTNSGTGFGSALRSIVPVGEISAMAQATRNAVQDVLRRVETQVRIAEATARFLRSRGIEYSIEKFCAIPVIFKIKLGSLDAAKEQTIVVAELGADAIPNLQEVKKSSKDNSWGTVIQFVKLTPQIRGFGSPAFYLNGDPNPQISHILRSRLSGKLIWRGAQHSINIEAALVWYHDTCGWCGKSFARAPFAIRAHLHDRRDHPRILAVLPSEDDEPAVRAIIENFEKRIGCRLGERWQPNGSLPGSPAIQNCPHCGYTHQDSLVPGDFALRQWPYSDTDWLFKVSAARGAWVQPDTPPVRWLPPERVWLDALKSSKRQREKAGQEQWQ